MEGMLRNPQYSPRLWTANGGTIVNQEVPLYIAELDEYCVPFVLKNTPDVLTMGRRCMNDVYIYIYIYTFVWTTKSNEPYFRRPEGTKIVLKVENYVPYLVTGIEANGANVAVVGGTKGPVAVVGETTRSRPVVEKTTSSVPVVAETTNHVDPSVPRGCGLTATNMRMDVVAPAPFSKRNGIFRTYR